jgi:hypothetical protein
MRIGRKPSSKRLLRCLCWFRSAFVNGRHRKYVKPAPWMTSVPMRMLMMTLQYDTATIEGKVNELMEEMHSAIYDKFVPTVIECRNTYLRSSTPSSRGKQLSALRYA